METAPTVPRHILVRGVNWLGDAVMTTPALRRLREKFPEARITLLTPAKLEGLWAHQPDITECASLPPVAGVWAAARLIRSLAPDVALLFPNSPRSGIEAWLGGVPRRVGYSRPWRNWTLTSVVPGREGRVEMRKRTVAEIREVAARNVPPRQFPAVAHQMHEYLELAAALGASAELCAPRLAVTDVELRAAGEKFLPGAWRDDPRVLIGLNPGAEYGPAKRWPVAYFAAVGKALSRRALFVIFGGRADEPLAEELERELGGAGAACANLAGKTSLRELCACLRLCGGLLTNDTGPMHLAAALGTPVAALFGSTSPELTGPGLPGAPGSIILRRGAPCSPCFLRECPIDFRCMKELGPEQAVQAVAKLARIAL